MLTTFLYFFLVFPVSRGLPHPDDDDVVIRSQLDVVPAGFVRYELHNRAVALPDELVQLTFAIPQLNMSGLHVTLLDISDPSSENYGSYLTKEEVAELVAPKPDSLEAVADWLRNNQIEWTARPSLEHLIDVHVPIRHANAIIGADYAMYLHERTNTTMLRTLSYSLPKHLHEHIEFVYPTTQFIPPVVPKASLRPIGSSQVSKRERGPDGICARSITPECLQQLYNIPSEPARSTNNSLYVTGMGGEVANHQDLQTFMSELRPDVENPTFDVLSVLGGTNDGDGTNEATMDIQYTVGLATSVPTTFASVAPRSGGIFLDQLLDEVGQFLRQDSPPSVLSTSYVFHETPQIEQLARAICDAYAQLGARGTSVIFAAGDSGVAGGFLSAPAECEGGAFVPTFPSTCPYVTSMGATSGLNPEIAAAFSSGGFSNMFPRPSYQDNAVNTYLNALGNTYQGRYNSTGRAYPDVSAHGVDYIIRLNGGWYSALGTSTSTPTFASIVALLNDQLLLAGKPLLGFLNPRLYSMGSSAMTDITAGSNPGCGTDGFPADVGWDPVTGLGTPDYNRMLAAITGRVVTENAQTGGARSVGPSHVASSIAFVLLLLSVISLVL
ncbi:family S53 protease [Earliella scabrosa]|nr:family S53 protease [Earliella scabrosa]